ncbi:hypothetical protein [Salinarimonas sp.]|uniref:hypothetical protein n=1 Tax=Salinarimonas sp. TaxID=2766526 RepID=UPI00391C449D
MQPDASRFCLHAIVLAVLALSAGIVVTVDAIAASASFRCAPAIVLQMDASACLALPSVTVAPIAVPPLSMPQVYPPL